MTKVKKILIFLVLAMVLIMALFPPIWVAVSSFRTRKQVFLPAITCRPTLQNYVDVLFNKDYLHCFYNSLIVSSFAVLIVLILAVSAGYAFSRLKFRGKASLLFFVITTRMALPAIFVVPYFLIFSKLNLVNTYSGLIITYTFINLGFGIWLMKSFFDEIPREIDEATMMDGCTIFTGFIRIILPLAKTGIITVAIFVFLFSWNEYLFALVLTRTETQTLPVFVPLIQG